MRVMTHRHTPNDAVPDANPQSQQLAPYSSSAIAAPNNVVDAPDAPIPSPAEQELSGSGGKSPLSEFDDYVAAERNEGARNGISRDLGLGFGFEVGDMVWGKVKSHPWWPGHVFDEAFASRAVRRTKRDGHVLVAFFGDSSYGWFEPAELIPFEENFAEKSQQLSSRTFLKAVEEAVDEASRRCGLGLVCRCRNPKNFHPAGVEGYFCVNVPDYEPGVYSSGQIRRARNGFVPLEMLGFVKELAMAPCSWEPPNIGFAKNKATVFALRKAVFEHYDETYAQAFGVQSSHPGDQQGYSVDQPMRQPARAPLSGPMVTADTLGDGKKNTKSVKVNDKVKKDKYLFKRRDEPSNSLQLASGEETPKAAGRYVFQKRAPDVSVAAQIIENHEDKGVISQDNAASALTDSVAVGGKIQPDSSGLASQAVTLVPEAKACLIEKGKGSSEEMTRNFEVDNVASKSMHMPDCSGEMALLRIVDETSQSFHLEGKTSDDVKHDVNVKLSGPHEDFQRTELGFLSVADGGNDVYQVKCASNAVYTSTVEVKPLKTSVDGAPKKVGHKRPADGFNSEIFPIGEKKKKKRSLNLQATSGHLEKHSTAGKPLHVSGKLIKKSFSIGLTPGEAPCPELAQVVVSASNLLPVDTKADIDLDLPQLLGDLQDLALDPFHGVKKGIPVVVRQCFLRFRSLVYQKSLHLSPPSENESPEVQVTKSHSSAAASDSPDDHVRASPPVKPVKHIVRPYDPSKAGRKRALSDRQEEITAKKLKKKDLKTLAAEKKAASQKTSEARRGDGKDSMVQALPKIVKPDSTRKVEHPSEPVEPTILVIKFPPKTSLPSVAELKARFARFGPMDQSGLRVFWKSCTCRVVFLHKVDAQAAHKYTVANQSLFGNVGVRCFLRALDDSASEVSEAAKARGDDCANETSHIKDQRQTSVSAQQPLPQPAIQLKSILKKSSGDELGQVASNGGSSKGTPRVKFMLGGEESSKGEQLVVGNRNNFNNASFADGGAPPVALDLISKNVEKVISQPLLPNPPLHTRFTKIPQHNLHTSDLAPRHSPNFINTTSVTATTVDVSQQMISLLTRCSDVVTNLTCLLGYVPYHPL